MRLRMRARRGYTLVELAIVLVVLGILLGASLLPLGARLREAKYADARSELAEIRSAVVSYAVQSSAPGFHWIHEAGGAINDFGVLGPGRRYLPCPDVDGDGREDRVNSTFTNAAAVAVNIGALLSNVGGYQDDTSIIGVGLTTTITMIAGGQTVTMYLREGTGATDSLGPNAIVRTTDESLRFVDDSAPSQLALGSGGYGFCTSDFGAVPWTTLGTPQADPWGNRYMYRVDPMFAHSGLGFGPESRSDQVDPLRPLALATVSVGLRKVGFNPAPSVYGAQVTRVVDAYRKRGATPIDMALDATYTIPIDPNPGLVCTAISAAGCSWSATAAASVALRDGEYLGVATGPFERNSLLGLGTGITVMRVIESGETLEGMAFVLLSTGQNGYGGLRSAENLQAGPLLVEAGLLSCNRAPEAGSPELTNMPGRLCLGTPPVASTDAHHHSFIQLPRHETTSYTYDDVLVHMSGSQLVGGLLAAGIDLGPVWIPPRAPR